MSNSGVSTLKVVSFYSPTNKTIDSLESNTNINRWKFVLKNIDFASFGSRHVVAFYTLKIRLMMVTGLEIRGRKAKVQKFIDMVYDTKRKMVFQ